MKKFMTSEALARDSRFKRVGLQDRARDRRMTERQRGEVEGKQSGDRGTRPRVHFSPGHPDAPDRARMMMHGIFVGEIQALEFQRVVDKLFSGGGFRGEEENSPIRLARRFRELAGFEKTEIDEIAQLSKEALAEARARRAPAPAGS